MVDNVDVPLFGSLTFLAVHVRGYQMCVLLLHRLCKVSPGSLYQVLQVDPRFARVVGDANARRFEERNAASWHGIVEQSASWRCPGVVRDEEVEPGKITNLLAGFVRIKKVVSISVFADVCRCTIEAVDDSTTSIFNVPFQSFQQMVANAKVSGEHDPFASEDV